MKKLIISFVLLLTNLTANESHWQGTIGKSKIYLQLDCIITNTMEDKNSCRFSRYFYETQLQDIVITDGWKVDENSIKLQVIHSDKIQEEFLLNYTNKELVGTWKSEGKRLNVVLKRLNLSDNYDAFEKFRIKFLKFKREKVEKLKGSNKELVWISEEHSDTSFFRLGNGFSKNTRAKVNPVLDVLQNEFSAGTLYCASSFNYGTGMEAIESKLTYLSKNLMAMEFHLSYFCGGPYPDFNTRRHLYDLNTGKRYKLEDILTIAKNPTKLRDLAFKANGMKLEENPSLEKDGYDPYNTSYWEHIDWEYKEKGIAFFLNFSTAERCFRGDSYFVPFELLEPYRNELFSYGFGE